MSGAGKNSKDKSGASLDDAVREALAGPAKEIADQIVKSSHFSDLNLFGNSRLMEGAVREALAGPAKEIADQIAHTSLAWLRNYSVQALEPSIFAGVARALASDQLASREYDYEPAIIEIDPGGTLIAPATIFERYEITVKSLRGLTSELDRLTGRLAPLTV